MRFNASEIWQWMLARRACSGHGEQNNQTEKIIVQSSKMYQFGTFKNWFLCWTSHTYNGLILSAFFGEHFHKRVSSGYPTGQWKRVFYFQKDWSDRHARWKKSGMKPSSCAWAKQKRTVYRRGAFPVGRHPRRIFVYAAGLRCWIYSVKTQSYSLQVTASKSTPCFCCPVFSGGERQSFFTWNGARIRYNKDG